MKNILAIDTCTEVCSVSLYTNGIKISRFVKGVAKSSGLILPFVYTKGPGAFTGVRMCIGVVQGMSLAHDIPTKGFSTLELVGFGAAKKHKSDKVAVALDARMGEVYWGLYQDRNLSNESLKNPSEVDILNQGFIGVGTGWGAYEAELSERTGVKHYVSDFYPRAENLIDLYLDQKSTHDNELPLPTYLRNNVAQKSLK